MKYIIGIIVTILGVANMASATNILDRLTQNDQQVVVTNDIQDPLRNGANNPGASVHGLYYQGSISTFLQAENQTIAFIQRIVTWSLTIIGIIAFIYLLYHGFLMITAAGDDTQFKKGAKAVRSAIIAIVGIAVSALLVNLILYIVSRII